MSKWGVYKLVREDGTVIIHLAPCDENAVPMPPHELSADCPCKPTLEHEDGTPYWDHKDPERSMH